MKALFIIQGEGRGHMTQALALEQILKDSGHEVSAMLIGTSKSREVPAYFKSKVSAVLHTFVSPNFRYDRDNKSINLWKTFGYNLLRSRKYLSELKKIHGIVKDTEPDLIINFYDLLGGLYFKWYKPQVKRICVAHQYMALHPEFVHDPNKPIQRLFFSITNKITSLNSDQKLALSFRDYPLHSKSLNIIPPLLRQEVFRLEPTNGDYLLVYMVNNGYAEDLMQWHQRNKRIKIHCFWDRSDVEDEWSPWQNLTFHQINDQKFLDLMASCMGYISTAGFESICEAMYLGKPVMMVPVERQYEQSCNALEAENVGAGIAASAFDLGPFLSYLSKPREDVSNFRDWVDLCPTLVVKEVESYVPYKVSRGLSLGIPRLVLNDK